MIARYSRVWTLGILSLLAIGCTSAVPSASSELYRTIKTNVKGSLTFYRGGSKVLDVVSTDRLNVHYMVSEPYDPAKDGDVWGKKASATQVTKGINFTVAKANGEGLGFSIVFQPPGTPAVTVGDLAGKAYSAPALSGAYAGSGNAATGVGPMMDLLQKFSPGKRGNVTLTSGGSPLVGSWTSDEPAGANGIERIDFNLTDL